MSSRLSPSLVLSVLALFFAVGGSAFAVGQRSAPQARCANGAVKAFAYVSGNPTVGIANMTEQFSSDPKLFRASFNCSGKPVQVRRNRDLFEVRFPGTAVKAVIVSSVGGLTAPWSVTPLPDGSFRITPAGVGQPTFQLTTQHQFLVVAV